MTRPRLATTLFPPEGIAFLRMLAENNTREWFTAHKKTFEAELKKPAHMLAEAVALGLETRLKTPVSCKVFRIHRDVRFSKDKTPFNCHIRMAFWPGGAGKARAVPVPAFYLSLEPNELICGAGAFAFPPDKLSAFRKCVQDPTKAAEITALVNTFKSIGHRIDEPELKRVPSGYTETSDETALLLRRKSLSAWQHTPYPTPPAGITAETCLAAFETLMPLYSWMATRL